MKCLKYQSLFTPLSLILFQVFLIFKTFSYFFFKIQYRSEAVVSLNILKGTVQCTTVKPMQYFVSIVKELTQTIAQH